jgi:hypothetical protein
MKLLPSFEECEDVLSRMTWCKPAIKLAPTVPFQGLTPVKEEDEFRSSMRSLNVSGDGEASSIVSIPLSSTRPPRTISIPFSDLAEPCENVLFATGRESQDLDDEELPLHLLVYRSLLQLPVDARSICMSRIIFVGGGSNLPGLKRRILDEITNLIDQKGWNPVEGKALQQLYGNPYLQRTRNRQPGPIEVPLQADLTSSPVTTAAFLEQESDPIEEQLKREASKRVKAVELGNLRAMESLGAWSGGSLLSQLRIPAVSVVDREQWIQHGASGASKIGEISVSQRQSMGPGAFKSGAGDRSSWTLGLWG